MELVKTYREINSNFEPYRDGLQAYYCDRVSHYSMIYCFENFELNTDRQELRCDGEVRPLQPQVYAMLELLVLNHDRVVTKDELNEKIWNGRIVSESVVNSRIRSVRQAVNDDGKSQRLIRTAHSRGFGFVATPTTSTGASPSDEGEGYSQSQSSVPILEDSSAIVTKTSKPVRRKKVSIAVLPFINMSQESGQDFFVNGICQDIITMLTKVPALSITSPLSDTSNYSHHTDLKKLNSNQQAEYVLEGSVRFAENRLRITAKLLDIQSGKHIWAERFERQMKDIFVLQDEMTREIISALQVKLTEGAGSRLLSSGASNFEAWEAIMKAHNLCLTRRETEVLEARKLIDNALVLDPQYTGAWSLLGYSYWAEYIGRWSEDGDRALSRGKEAVQRALNLDETDSNALGTLALIEVSLEHHEKASELASRALEYGPGNTFVIGVAAVVKMFCGEAAAAEALARDALRLSPIHRLGAPEVLASVLMHVGKFEEAAEIALERIETDPDYASSYFILTWYYIEMGRLKDAENAAENILRLNPRFTIKSFAERQPHRDWSVVEPLLSAFRKAGLPES